jgi:hypothetical protein
MQVGKHVGYRTNAQDKAPVKRFQKGDDCCQIGPTRHAALAVDLLQPVASWIVNSSSSSFSLEGA